MWWSDTPSTPWNLPVNTVLFLASKFWRVLLCLLYSKQVLAGTRGEKAFGQELLGILINDVNTNFLNDINNKLLSTFFWMSLEERLLHQCSSSFITRWFLEENNLNNLPAVAAAFLLLLLYLLLFFITPQIYWLGRKFIACVSQTNVWGKISVS